MRATVCQLPDNPAKFETAMAALAKHISKENSEFLLLPEMPFFPWIAYENNVSAVQWQAAVDAHEEWISRLSALDVNIIVASKPVLDQGVPHNDAFAIDSKGKENFLHRKYYLPDEDGTWEATWYRRAKTPSFEARQIASATLGAMICTDIWFGEHARKYAKQGVQIIVNPRATEISSVDKWLAGGRVAAVMAGAFCLSSNRDGQGKGFEWGGMGWIIDPNGEVLATTNEEQPFVTVNIDLSKADEAKNSYPRYVKE